MTQERECVYTLGTVTVPKNKRGCVTIRTLFFVNILSLKNYCKNEISTPAATAEPITPEMLLAIQ